LIFARSGGQAFVPARCANASRGNPAAIGTAAAARLKKFLRWIIAIPRAHNTRRHKGERAVAEDLNAELERLRAENAALKRPDRGGKPWLKVSEKGAVSVYGMGRFPVTLYKEQWLRLLAIADEIKAFITANDERLKSKES